MNDKKPEEIREEIAKLERLISDSNMKIEELNMLSNKDTINKIRSCKIFSSPWSIAICRWQKSFILRLTKKSSRKDYRDYEDLIDLIGHDVNYSLNEFCYICNHDGIVSVNQNITKI